MRRPDYDLRVRHAFFAESRNIGRSEVLLEIAAEAGLETESFARALESGEARKAVLEEARMGKALPAAWDAHAHARRWDEAKAPHRLPAPPGAPDSGCRRAAPCCGESCLAETRELFEQALL